MLWILQAHASDTSLCKHAHAHEHGGLVVRTQVLGRWVPLSAFQPLTSVSHLLHTTRLLHADTPASSEHEDDSDFDAARAPRGGRRGAGASRFAGADPSGLDPRSVTCTL